MSSRGTRQAKSCAARRNSCPPQKDSLLDSGSSLVVRPPTSQDVGGLQIPVKLAGTHKAVARKLPSGELAMAGEPLLPLGRSIRRGSWSFFWPKGKDPTLSVLTEDQIDQIQSIVRSGDEVIHPYVKEDLPYVRNSDAVKVRQRIALDREPTLPSARVLKSETSNQIKQIVIEEQSVPFIGFKCKEFAKWRNSCKEAKAVTDAAIDLGEINTDDIGRMWKHKASSEDFLLDLDQVIQQILEPEEEPGPQQRCFHHTPTEESGGKVSFGDDVVKHFFGDDKHQEDWTGIEDSNPILAYAMKVARKKHLRAMRMDGDGEIDAREAAAVAPPVKRPKKLPKFVGLEDLSTMEKHNLCHEPARADCEVCQASKKRHKPWVRDSSTKCDDAKLKGSILLTMDWASPSETSSSGARFLAVIGYVEKGCAYAKGFKVKQGASATALHEARVAWGIEDKPFVLHSDNEAILKCQDMKSYLRKQAEVCPAGGVALNGVPHRSNTNSRAERFVRSACEGIRSLIFQAGIPTKWWHVASDAYSVESARIAGIKPRFNETPPIAFGTLGEAILPTGILFKDKFQSRTNFVAHMGCESSTSGGVKVLYSDAAGRLKRATILSRDVVWKTGQFALKRCRKGLGFISELFPKMAAANPVTQFQVNCCECQSWRFVDRATQEKFELRFDRFILRNTRGS